VFENVVATCNLLEYARRGCERFLYFSTDEVFGPAPEGVRYKEWDRYKSGNPYAATKAGGEELAIAFHNTYGVPVVVTHTMNVFGERQHPEKFIPSTIRKVRDGETVTVHADKTRTKAGTRFYIHAAHVANAVRFVLANGTPGDKYNIVGEKEVSNLALAHEIAKSVGKSLNFEMVDFHSSRPGHDLRYALDGSKLAEMGWTPPNTFEKSLSNTVHWTLRNERWLRS
jgi:dTDP-glucose 4,6-dehydratase